MTTEEENASYFRPTHERIYPPSEYGKVDLGLTSSSVIVDPWEK